MRIEEVFMYQTPEIVMEAPYSMSQSMADKAKGSLKGVFGGGQEEQGQREAGKKANVLFKELRRYIGQTMGKGQTSVPADIIQSFLKSKGLPADLTQQTYTVDEAGKAVLTAVRSGFQGKQYQEPEQAPAQQSTQQPPAKAPVDEPTDNVAAKPADAYASKPTGNAPSDLSIHPAIAQLSTRDRKSLIDALRKV